MSVISTGQRPVNSQYLLLTPSKKTMKNKRLIELAVKIVVAALTAFLTALGTTSCMGYGPF